MRMRSNSRTSSDINPVYSLNPSVSSMRHIVSMSQMRNSKPSSKYINPVYSKSIRIKYETDSEYETDEDEEQLKAK